MNICEWIGCEKQAVVGLGHEPSWVCMEHFELGLEAISASIKEMLGIISVTHVEITVEPPA